MYEEKRRLSFKDILIQLLLVVLFVLILIWIFPTKGYLKDNYVQKDGTDISDKLQALYGRLYADNVESMKDAGKDYFTTPRLPKNVGDSVTLTLGDMLDKKLVLPFKDSNNESCDTTKSYIQLTKMDDEYQMKVQLTCSDYSDYIIVYMGCYNYCEGSICETKKPETPVSKPDKPSNPKPVDKKYKYEYAKDLGNEYSTWGPWSDWSTSSMANDNLTEIDKRTRTIMINDGSGWGIIDHKLVQWTEYEDRTTYEEKAVEVPIPGKYTEITNTKKNLVETKAIPQGNNGYYTDWILTNSSYETKNSVTNSTTKKYEWRSSRYAASCSGCGDFVLWTTYRVYEKKYVAPTNGSCSSLGKDWVQESGKCNRYETTTTTVRVPLTQTVITKVPVTKRVPVVKSRWEPIYGETNGTPVYRDVVEYRYRKRTQTQWAGKVYEWSTSNSDQKLLGNGYYLTGKKEQV